MTYTFGGESDNVKNKAFTLIELIIVIAILSIIMLIGVPAFANIVERIKVRSDKASANEIGEAISVREVDVSEEERVEYYPKIVRYDQIENIERYVTDTHRPQSMKDGYYFVTALQVGGAKKILVGIGKEEMPVTNIAYIGPKASGWAYVEADEISEFLSKYNGLLTETVEMPDNYEVVGEDEETTEENISNLKVGQYVKYTPSTERYTANGGASSSTFYPSKETVWQIFSINGSTISLISSDSVGSLTLEGKTGYKNAVSILNNIANAYVNGEYATSGRSIGSGSGSIGEIDETSNPITWEETYTNGKNGSPYKDVLHRADKAIIKDNESLHISSDVWLASRHIIVSEEHTYFAVRYLPSNNEEAAYSIFASKANGAKESLGSKTLGVRPIITLRSYVEISGGNGTLGNPYTLSVRK